MFSFLRKMLGIFAVVLFAATTLFAAPQDARVEGEILVAVDPLLVGVSHVAGLSPEKAGSVSLSVAERVASFSGGEVSSVYGGIASSSGYVVVHIVSPGKSTDELLRDVSALPGVVGVSENRIVRMSATPNDTYWSLQKGFERVGVRNVWDAATGSASMFAAVVDTGVDWNHPDLAANMGTDLNGARGYNAISGNYTPMDDQGHGTHVAGTIGAVGNNSLGVAGMSWRTKILAVKVLGSDGSGTYSTIIAGLNYIVEQKRGELDIRTANMSLGGWAPTIQNPELHPLGIACKAVSDAGILLVVAAGNEGQNISSPASYPGQRPYPASFTFNNMITVGSVNNSGAKSSFSNYGPSWVHIAAPGESVPSTLRGGGYGYMSGTSMATPHVAGAAQLLFSKTPSASTGAMKSTILSAARAGTLTGFFRYGELDVSSLGGVPSPTPTPTPAPTPTPTPTPTVPVKGITVSPASASIYVGAGIRLQATITPSNATDKRVVWSSSNVSVATVDQSGNVRGKAKGVASIFAKTPDGKFSAVSQITVSLAPVRVSSIKVIPVRATLAAGKKLQLSWAVSPANATNKNAVFSSSAPATATVSAKGVVEARAPGRAVVTIKAADGGGAKATCAINVVAPVVPVSKIVLSPKSMSLLVGASARASAVVSPANATNKTVVWSTNNAKVASVSSKGVVLGRSPGNAVITARSADGKKSATMPVKVSAKPAPVRVKGLKATPTKVTASAGVIFRITPLFIPANATERTVVWSSRNPKTAFVKGGTVTAKAPGSTVVSLQSKDGGFKASVSVTVLVRRARPTSGGVVPESFGASGGSFAFPAFSPAAHESFLELDEEQGGLFISEAVLSEYAEGSSDEAVRAFPLFESAVESGGRAVVSFEPDIEGLDADSLRLASFSGEGYPVFFERVDSPDEMTDGTFILTDSEYLPIPRGTGRSSELGDRVVLALFDGGAFDIDERDGFVSSSVAVSGNFAEPTDSSSQEGGEGGGCAAAGSSPGALLLGIPVLVAAIRRKNEG